MKMIKLLSVAILGFGISVYAADAKKDRGPVEASQPADPSKPHVVPTIGTIERLDPSLDTLLAPDAQIEKLAGGFEWSEGPVWVSRGNYLLFSDVPRNIVFLLKE